ncbi:hypothetical protein SLA2020_325100 [Shorea laevis]
MGAITAAIGDLVLTFLWVFCSSTFGLLTTLTVTTFGLQGIAWAPVAITTVLIFAFVFVFSLIAEALGGASFNPTGNASIFAAGLGGDSLISMALRFPAQAAGAVGGVLAITEVMPVQYKNMIGGPSLKVDVHTGAIAEGLLTFLISFAVLLIIFKGPRNGILQAWLLALVTVALVVSGTHYTGPSMNPANAYGWAYLDKWHNTPEHFYVYWISPFIGAILAAWVFRIFFPPPAPKQKKA